MWSGNVFGKLILNAEKADGWLINEKESCKHQMQFYLK